MVEVPTLARDLLVGTLQEPHGLASSLAAFLAPGDAPLRFHQSLLCLAIVARIGHLLSVGQRQEGLQAQIDTCFFTC